MEKPRNPRESNTMKLAVQPTRVILSLARAGGWQTDVVISRTGTLGNIAVQKPKLRAVGCARAEATDRHDLARGLRAAVKMLEHT